MSAHVVRNADVDRLMLMLRFHTSLMHVLGKRSFVFLQVADLPAVSLLAGKPIDAQVPQPFMLTAKTPFRMHRCCSLHLCRRLAVLCPCWWMCNAACSIGAVCMLNLGSRRCMLNTTFIWSYFRVGTLPVHMRPFASKNGQVQHLQHTHAFACEASGVCSQALSADALSTNGIMQHLCMCFGLQLDTFQRQACCCMCLKW